MRLAGFCVALLCVTPLLQAETEEFRVYNDAPRLLLTAQRLRLLQRERERQSMRWQQFDALVGMGAALPEPGFALALYYRISGQAPTGKQAVDWALSDQGTDLRQLALVFDWCGPVMSPQQADKLAAKLQQALKTSARTGIPAQSARALAAIALADRLPDHGESILKPLIEQWWRGEVIKAIAGGKPAISRNDVYALLELFHAIRDNLKIDLRDGAPAYFKTLPTDHLVSHYPAPLNTPDNEYRIPIYVRDGEPIVNDAIQSRAAELAMVAFDNNAGEIQFVQGWLMQDRFQMRNAMGAPYEFLWANPYQPGLSYFQAPLVYHDPATGHIFARTSWEEDAQWLGYFDGHLQIFRDGQIQTLKSGVPSDPVHMGDAVILAAKSPEAFKFRADAVSVFVVNLTPRATYQVEIDDQELIEAETDVGGTLVLTLPEGVSTGARIQQRME